MEFNVSTFVLEVVNFLILVWLLRRYLYAPIVGVIEDRRASIAAMLDDARVRESKAEALERQYRDRLEAWESEKRTARESWLAELNIEKARMVDSFRKGLESEREQAAALDRRRLEMDQLENERRAIDLGARFAARLLERVSGPDLEARLMDVFIDDLSRVPEERWQSVASSAGEGSAAASVVSAFPLTERQRADLQQAISAQIGQPIICRFREDATLIAGLRFEYGSLSLKANLVDELEFFRSVA